MLHKILYECFEKKGLKYECVISPKDEQSMYDACQAKFLVIMKLPQQNNYVRFVLSSAGNGHWEPNERKLIDPWIADVIGRIILENY
jgi:hypothetical protein